MRVGDASMLARTCARWSGPWGVLISVVPPEGVQDAELRRAFGDGRPEGRGEAEQPHSCLESSLVARKIVADLALGGRCGWRLPSKDTGHAEQDHEGQAAERTRTLPLRIVHDFALLREHSRMFLEVARRRSEQIGHGVDAFAVETGALRPLGVLYPL